AVRQRDSREIAIAEARAQRRRVEALPARVIVVPNAEIERELVEGRAYAAVEVDLGRGAIGERDALAGNAGVALEVRIPIIARLEAGLRRRLMIRLGDAA